MTSAVGYTLAFDNANGIRATRGQRIVLSQDFAGLGGDVKYLRTRVDATKFKGLPKNFIMSMHVEGGYIHPLGSSSDDRDPIRITDRFFGAQLRGFDIRGIGPRIKRTPYDTDDTLLDDQSTTSEALGGHAYYMGRLEVEFPTSSGLRSLGIRPSAYVDAGSVFKLRQRNLFDQVGIACNPTGTTTGGAIDFPDTGGCPTGYVRVNGYKEELVGNSAKPRLSVGIGMNWTSPFGPLRLDLAKALMKQDGDDTKLFSFNVGTQF